MVGVSKASRIAWSAMPAAPSASAISRRPSAVIASACDLRLASPKAKIAFLFTKVGLSGPDMGAGWLLPRIVGLSHATELLMTGDFISAERAAEIGLYNRVVPQEALLDEALPETWDCGTNTTDEANQVIKTGPELGGVLCCKDL